MYFCYLTFPVRVCSGNKFGIKWPQKAWKETPFLMEGSWPFGLVVEVQQQHRASTAATQGSSPSRVCHTFILAATLLVRVM